MGSTLKKCGKILKNDVILILQRCPLLCFHPVQMVGDFKVSLCSGVPIWFVLSKVSTHSEQAISHLAYQTFRRCYKIYYLLSMVCFGVQNVCMKGIGLNQIALQIVSSLLQNLLLSYNVLYDQTNLQQVFTKILHIDANILQSSRVFL